MLYISTIKHINLNTYRCLIYSNLVLLKKMYCKWNLFLCKLLILICIFFYIFFGIFLTARFNKINLVDTIFVWKVFLRWNECFWWVYMCVDGYVCIDGYRRKQSCMGLLSNIWNCAIQRSHFPKLFYLSPSGFGKTFL